MVDRLLDPSGNLDPSGKPLYTLAYVVPTVVGLGVSPLGSSPDSTLDAAHSATNVVNLTCSALLSA